MLLTNFNLNLETIKYIYHYVLLSNIFIIKVNKFLHILTKKQVYHHHYYYFKIQFNYIYLFNCFDVILIQNHQYNIIITFYFYFYVKIMIYSML